MSASLKIYHFKIDNSIGIGSVYVPKQERGKGKARALLLKTIKEWREKYPTAIMYIEAKPEEKGITLEGLVSLYQSVGFVISSKEKDRVYLELHPT